MPAAPLLRLASLITDDLPLHTRKIVRDHGCGTPGWARSPRSSGNGRVAESGCAGRHPVTWGPVTDSVGGPAGVAAGHAHHAVQQRRLVEQDAGGAECDLRASGCVGAG